jgi:hypothetical protein
MTARTRRCLKRVICLFTRTCPFSADALSKVPREIGQPDAAECTQLSAAEDEEAEGDGRQNVPELT